MSWLGGGGWRGEGFLRFLADVGLIRVVCGWVWKDWLCFVLFCFVMWVCGYVGIWVYG